MESEIRVTSLLSKLVSIIVPVYNAEGCIASCIDSILNQSYNNVELIIVIDGSPDNSASICRQYEKKDGRVHVIEKDNGGVSSARNEGILRAHGDYICFVDADDTISPSMIERMVERVEKKDSDLCICGFKVMGSNLILNDTMVLKEMEEVVNKEELIHAIINTSRKRVFGYAWRCLFKKSVLIDNQILFPETIRISEDYMFFLQFVYHSKSVCVLPEELYYYRINDASATAKYMPSLHSDMHYINNWMRENVCTSYPTTEVGYHCCESNTYLRTVQNLCRQGTPFTLLQRIKTAYIIKRDYRYEEELWKSLKGSKDLSVKNIVSYVALFLFQEWLYIVLFSIKNKT